MRTNIWKFEKGMIIDPTNSPEYPLVWIAKIRLWERSRKPMKYDLSKGVELTCEDLVRGHITKVTPIEEEAGPKKKKKAPSVDGRAKEVSSGDK